jgi:hypothetical protein
MSRRSRRRNGGGEKRWLGKAVVGLLVLGVVVLGGGYAAVRGYLHSEEFRKFLSAEAGKVAGVTGEFSPFRWQGLAVDTEGFKATGNGLVTSVTADGLHTEVGLGGLKRGVWEIKGTNVRRLEVSVDARKRVDEETIAKEERKSEKRSSRPGWLPSDAELQGMEVKHLSVKSILDEGIVTATGMRVTAEQAGAKDAYRAEISNGTIVLPFKLVPELRLDHIRARYQDRQVFISDARMEAWESGLIEATGEWDTRSSRYSLEGNAKGIQTEDLLGPDWAKRLTGDVVSDFTFENPTGSPQARGKLTINNAVLTALPILDSLAAYADTRRFRVLTLNEAQTDWQWRKGELSLSNLILSSEGLVRLEGNLIIRGRELDGIFRLGLAPGTLSRIPGAETDVFLSGERGLLWAPLRITGTLDDPKEDLTDRLMAAAGMRMFDMIPETGEKVIKFTRNVLESPETAEKAVKAVETGVKVIEEGSKAVREVGGILDGILGGGSGGKEKEDP